MLRDGRYRYVVRRGRDHLISSGNCLAWLASTVAGGGQPVWLGDSHVGHLTRSFSTANVLRSADGDVAVHLGARLMYSISRDGFPRWAIRLLRIRGRLGRKPLTLVVCLGEIDVRCHLAARMHDREPDLAFVGDYVAQVLALARSAGADRVAFLVPPPPCLDQMDTMRFPVDGTFDERVRVFDALRARLAGEVDARSSAASPRVVVVDATAELWDPERGIRQECSDDRCHANAHGAQLVRHVLDERLATTAAR